MNSKSMGVTVPVSAPDAELNLPNLGLLQLEACVVLWRE